MGYKTKISSSARRRIRLSAMRHALCALPYAHNYQPQFLTFPASHLPSFLACPAPRNSQPASRNTQLSPEIFPSFFSIRNPKSKIRNRKARNPHPASGFTLMEILLAFLILAIVMSTILGSFNAVFSTTDTLL